MADIYGKRYSCPECPFATYDAFDFRLHAQDGRCDVEGRFAFCDECDFVTTTVKLLRVHIMHIHINVGRFACEQCDYKTSTGEGGARLSNIDLSRNFIPVPCPIFIPERC